MKVLFINSVCKSGSTGNITYDLYKGVIQNGDAAAICYGRGRELNEKNVYRFAPVWEVYLHAALTRVTGLTGCFSPIATHRLMKFIENYQPDIIHIHELHAYFVNLKPLLELIKKKNIRVIWTFHCEFMYTGKCGYTYECDKWQEACSNCKYVHDYPKSLFFDFTRQMFLQKKRLFEGIEKLTVVTPSKWLADRVEKSFLNGYDIRVIYNGINLNVFNPSQGEDLKQKLNIDDEKIVLAVAADIMTKRKGGEYVVKLAERLKDKNIKFILVGVKDLTQKFPDNVIAISRTESQNELAEYYSLADVFIICSQIDNFPTTCLEALSCGTPICGFDVGGTKETAPDGYGVFVPYGDLDMLEQKVYDLLYEPNYFNPSEELTQFAREHYDKNIMVSNYLQLYNEQ